MTQTPRAWDPKVVLEGDSIKIDDLKVSFHRTIRDHKDYYDNAIPKSMPGANQETEMSESSACSLPASMGRFPLARCDDYRQGLPDGMENEGGIFFPMYRKSVPMLFFESPTLINLLDSEREAMWISFVSDNTYAIKVFAGNVNAISGKPDTASHEENQATRKDLTLQDFVVTPHQHWLDGVATEAGRVQFVAMPMGSGHSTGAPVTGQDSVGRLSFEGSQVCLNVRRYPAPWAHVAYYKAPAVTRGYIRQKIARIPFHNYRKTTSVAFSVRILDSRLYEQATGRAPPASPITPELYAEQRLPFLELYEELPAAPTDGIVGVKAVATIEGTLDESLPNDILKRDAVTGAALPGWHCKGCGQHIHPAYTRCHTCQKAQVAESSDGFKGVSPVGILNPTRPKTLLRLPWEVDEGTHGDI
ncbi:uncharacterized protein E0L32_006820 [Thyridium curvatum]|uniref:Uncharacterized protein n=1 Tax=Thyridium curvatum TaxID=1093900 RepID=A0A507B6F2_9PEZI|nr:uncharacterized protein E0L32_006820 [Thyridium curvatum]TPX12408.1 hypothetical protein E0L32_006820 [Thyridium curvatum]